MPTGKNKVKMSELQNMLSKSGYEDVRTYIASGNVLVKSDKKADEIESHVQDILKNKMNVDLVVMVRSATQIEKLLTENPFSDKKYDQSRIFYVSFKTTPGKNVRSAVESLMQEFVDEAVVLTRHGGYMYIPGNATRSKVSNNWLEKQLGVSSTTRNANTLNKLLFLARE